jgi:hypothetical protein
MDWNRDMTVIDGRLYADDRWLGTFSTHAAALDGLSAMRGQIDAAKSLHITADDVDLLLAIDADED